MSTAVTELEERLTRLEAEVQALKRERGDAAPAQKPWWEQISGVFKDSPEFEEAMRLGREWRNSQRMEYDEDDAALTEQTEKLCPPKTSTMTPLFAPCKKTAGSSRTTH